MRVKLLRPVSLLNLRLFAEHAMRRSFRSRQNLCAVRNQNRSPAGEPAIRSSSGVT